MTNLYPSGMRHHYSPDGKSVSTISDGPIDAILLSHYIADERARGNIEFWDVTIINGPRHMPYFGPYIVTFDFKTMIWTATALYNDGTDKPGTYSSGFIMHFDIKRVLLCLSNRSIEINLRALAKEQRMA